jgi:hypothetical protein
MQYLRARYYDQNNGRFNRLDPINGNAGDPQSLHKYAYAHGNPVMGIDPSGKFFTLVGQLVTASVRLALRTFKLTSIIFAKTKIEISLAIAKGLFVGTINEVTNALLSGKSKLSKGVAFTIGFIAGFIAQMIAFKLPTIPRGPAIVESLIINFGSEIFDNKPMTSSQFLFYIGEALFWGQMGAFFNKYIPADLGKDAIVKFVLETDVAFLTNVVRGYRKEWLNY